MDSQEIGSFMQIESSDMALVLPTSLQHHYRIL